jgi:hypothetical protein
LDLTTRIKDIEIELFDENESAKISGAESGSVNSQFMESGKLKNLLSRNHSIEND